MSGYNAETVHQHPKGVLDTAPLGPAYLRRLTRGAPAGFSYRNVTTFIKIAERFNIVRVIGQTAGKNKEKIEYCKQDKLCGCYHGYNTTTSTLSVECLYRSPCDLALSVYSVATRCFMLRISFERFGSSSSFPIIDYTITDMFKGKDYKNARTRYFYNVPYFRAHQLMDHALKRIFENTPSNVILPIENQFSPLRTFGISVTLKRHCPS